MKITKKRYFAGFSMLELAIVLGIVSVVIGGVWSVAGSTRSAVLASRLEQQTLAIASSVRDYYATRALESSPIIASTFTSTLRTAGVFPEEMCPASCVSGSVTTVYNAYGGTAEVSIPDPGTTPINIMEIDYTNVSKRGCVELALKLSARPSEIGLQQVSIDTDMTSFPIDIATVDSECNDTNNMSVFFSIRK